MIRSDQFFLVPGFPQWDWGGLGNTLTLNSTNTKLAYRHPCVYSGEYDRIRIRMTTVTSAQPVRVGLQALSAGLPSGVWLGANGSGFGYIPSPVSNTTYTVSLNEAVSRNVGDDIVVVAEWSGSAGTLILNRSLSHNASPTTFNAVSSASENVGTRAYTSSTWQSVQQANPSIGVYCSTGDNFYTPFTAIPANSGTYTTYNSSTSPDEIGNRASCPAGTVVGMLYGGRVDDDIQYTLYEDNWTPITSGTYNNSNGWNATYGATVIIFPSSVMLTSGTYRFTAKPLSTTNSYYQRSLYEAEALKLLPQLSSIQSTARTNEGSVVDTDYQMYSLSLIYSYIENTVVTQGSGTSSPRIRLY